MANMGRLKPIEIPEGPENLTLCFYGQSGTGKTLIAGGWPERPVLHLACDPGRAGGATTLRQLPGGLRPTVVRLESWKDFLAVEEDIRREVVEGRFRTVVVDSLTYLQSYIGLEMLKGTGREALRIDDYRLLQARTRRLITFFADLPATTIFTCLEASEKDELTGALIRLPDLVGQLGRAMPQFCDVVARFAPQGSFDRTGKRVTRYLAYVDGDESFVAKDRTGLLPKVLDLTGPSWEAFEPILGKGGE